MTGADNLNFIKHSDSSGEAFSSDIKLRRGGVEVYISSKFGAMVTQVMLAGQTLLHYQPSEYSDSASRKPRGGIPILFPYCGPISGALQHGGVRESSNWEVKDIKRDKSSATFGIDTEKIESYIKKSLNHVYGAGHRFKLELKITVTDSGLRYDMRFKNLGDKTAYYSPGLHPYFDIEHSHQGDIASNLKVDFSKRKWPNMIRGKRPVSGQAWIGIPSGKKILVNSSNEFGEFNFWSPDTKADFMCFEPMVAYSDNMGKSIQLKSNEEKELFVEFIFSD